MPATLPAIVSPAIESALFDHLSPSVIAEIEAWHDAHEQPAMTDAELEELYAREQLESQIEQMEMASGDRWDGLN